MINAMNKSKQSDSPSLGEGGGEAFSFRTECTRAP